MIVEKMPKSAEKSPLNINVNIVTAALHIVTKMSRSIY